MATLQGALAELVAVIITVDGINYAPTNPNEQITSSAAAMTYATDGISTSSHGMLVKDLHSIQIAVVAPLNDLNQSVISMLPLYEKVTTVLYNNRNDPNRNPMTNSNYHTFGDINYTLGPIEWPSGDVMYGYVFTITNLKIENTLEV